METKRLRVFLTVSHLSTLYMSLYAKHSQGEGDTDVLITDTGTRRRLQLEFIRQTSEIYRWTVYHNFATTVPENFDYAPGAKKKFIRRAKHLPIVAFAYEKMRKLHLHKRDLHYRKALKKIFSSANIDEPGEVEFFLLTQTYLNRPLLQLFPDAKITYMEHGIGDYLHVFDSHLPKGKFCGVFSKDYRTFLASKGTDTRWIIDLPGINDFEKTASDLLLQQSNLIPEDLIPKQEKPIVYILLEALDMYHVPQNFWTDYIDHILRQLPDPHKFHFLLKPHLIQSHLSLRLTVEYFSTLGLSYSLLDDPVFVSCSAEILFSKLVNQTEHVFCLFSSSGFYLSHLYKKPWITYWYSSSFPLKYISNAPPEYKKVYSALIPYIENVFSKNCQPY